MRITKGELTKKKIEEASKELFYEKGYKATLVKDIIEKVGIAPGNLTYYFPTKDTIAVEIITQNIAAIDQFLKDNVPDISKVMLRACNTLIFYTNMFNDKNMTRFYAETSSKKIVHYMIREKRRNSYYDLIDEAGIDMSEVEFDVFKFADVGARFELINAFFGGKFAGLNPMKFVRLIFITSILLLKGQADDVEDILAEAKEIISKLDYSHLTLL